MSVPREASLRVKVYYEDTDSLGIVYYANYLKYFERGRTELFESAGLNLLEWNQKGFNVAVFKANITYHAPARLGDVCEVRTYRLEGRSGYRLPLKQELWLNEQCITEADIQLVCLDRDFELQEFPEEWLVDAGCSK